MSEWQHGMKTKSNEKRGKFDYKKLWQSKSYNNQSHITQRQKKTSKFVGT
jgi:hypothetical protein